MLYGENVTQASFKHELQCIGHEFNANESATYVKTFKQKQIKARLCINELMKRLGLEALRKLTLRSNGSAVTNSVFGVTV